MIIVVEGHLHVGTVHVDDPSVAECLVEHGVARLQGVELALGCEGRCLGGLAPLLGPALEPPGSAMPRGLAAALAQLEARALAV